MISLLSFQTQYHCNNFLDTVDRAVECRIDRERFGVTCGGHDSLVRPHPMSALHSFPEPPRTRRLSARGIVAAQHHGRALLRRLHRRDHQPRPLESDVDGRRREPRRVAQPEASHRKEDVLPQRRDDVAPLPLGLRDGRDRELDAAGAEALRQRRGSGPPGVPGPRGQIPARQLAHRA